MSRLGKRGTLYGIVAALLAAVVVGSQLPAVSVLLSGTTAKEDIPVLDDSGATATLVEATVEGYNGFAFDFDTACILYRKHKQRMRAI